MWIRGASRSQRGIEHQRPGGSYGDGSRWGIARTVNLHLQPIGLGGERQYQAIPDNCFILEKARANPEYADVLIGCGYLHGGGAPGAYDPIYEEFVADVEELIRNHPGIDQRNCSVDRSWDVLHFLLSEERRQGNFNGTDLGTIALPGATAVGCSGDWPRYTPPSLAESVLVFLNNITEPELLRWHD